MDEESILTAGIADRRRQIEDLEMEIEALARSAEGCRKLLLLAKLLAATGGLLLAALVLGLLRADPLVLVLGLTAIPASAALYGTNRRTLDDLEADIARREGRRRDIIDQMDLRAV